MMRLEVLVKTGARKTEIISGSLESGFVKIALKAQPVGGEANALLLKFLRKETGRTWEIVLGEDFQA